MLESGFKEEYRSLLTKMLRFCNNMKEEEEQVKYVDFDKDIFDLDIMPFFAEKGLNFKDAVAKPMSEESEILFAKLFPL